MFSKASATGRPRGKADGRKGAAVPSLLGPDFTVTGDIVSEGEIQIDGAIDGDVRCARLIVGESGRIRCQISADQALIRGTVDGQIEAKSVVLTSSARVVGDIHHQTLTIEPGAQLDGRCEHHDVIERAKETRFNVVVSDGVNANGTATTG